MQPDRVGKRPDVGVVTCCPAAVVDAVIVLGGLLTGDFARQRLDESEQWLMELAEVGGLGRPVVLLKVDVHRVVGAPRRQQVFVPESLQVGGHSFGARTGYHQIASVLEIELLQVRILLVHVGILQ